MAGHYLAAAAEALRGGLDRGDPVDHVLKMTPPCTGLTQMKAVIAIASEQTTGATRSLLAEAIRSEQNRLRNL